MNKRHAHIIRLGILMSIPIIICFCLAVLSYNNDQYVYWHGGEYRYYDNLCVGVNTFSLFTIVSVFMFVTMGILIVKLSTRIIKDIRGAAAISGSTMLVASIISLLMIILFAYFFKWDFNPDIHPLYRTFYIHSSQILVTYVFYAILGIIIAMSSSTIYEKYLLKAKDRS